MSVFSCIDAFYFPLPPQRYTLLYYSIDTNLLIKIMQTKIKECDMPFSDAELKQMLDFHARCINNPDFIDQDPVQFPRRFDALADIEIVSLLSATIAWGNRKMICRNCERILQLMDNHPYDFVMDEGYEELPDMNIHRTFFAENLKNYLRGLHLIYSRHGSLEAFARHLHIADSDFPSWILAEGINRTIAEVNGGKCDSRCLPQNLESTALKRLNMALRWLVRDDGIVDLGVWKVIKPSQLFIPLDVHVANVSRQLGLLTRKSNDKKAVVELTSKLREFNPLDPIIYDYALFGMGMEMKTRPLVPGQILAE